MSQAPPANPYAPPQATIGSLPGAVEADEAERIRRELLSHETSLRTVGTLHWISGVLALFAALLIVAVFGIALLTEGVEEAFGDEGDVTVVVGLGLVLLYCALGLLTAWIGRGLRRLDPRVKGAAIVLSAIGLLGFPLGTLISLYILYLLLSQKGSRILSTEYHAIIAQTPHIRHRTAVWLWIVLALLLIGVVVVIGLAVAGV